MLEARRAFNSAVRSWRERAATARSSTVLSIVMVSGSRCTPDVGFPKHVFSPVAVDFVKSASEVWSIYGRVEVIHFNLGNAA